MGTTKLFQMVKSTDANVCKTLYIKKKKHTPPKIKVVCLREQQLIKSQKYLSTTKLCSLLIAHHGEFSQGC